MKVILFGSEHCGSCKRWKPLFERLMNEYQLNHEYVDIDKINKAEYQIQGVPVTIFYNDNDEELGRILGNMDEDIARKQIEYYKNV
jgi:thiol-disulfide isomerase/thioredoxin